MPRSKCRTERENSSVATVEPAGQHFSSTERASDMRTLHPFAAERREGLCGIRILDPFGGHRQIETLGEIGQQAHDFDVKNLLLIIADKGGADFDFVER